MVDSEAQKLRGAVSRSLARQVDSAHGNRIAMRCRLVGVALQQSSIAQEFQEVSLLLVPPKSQRRTSSTDPECHSTRHSPCGGTHWLRGAGLRQAASLLARSFIVSFPTQQRPRSWCWQPAPELLALPPPHPTRELRLRPFRTYGERAGTGHTEQRI
jgi:hypothetical protein